MSNVVLRMEHVYKRFRKGEAYNSLRDLLPALTGRMFRQQEVSDKDKRDFWALRDISFEVKQGEVLGIIGRNGAGKSTILKILSRIMEPTKGSMLVNGRLSALIEVSAGFHQDLTGRENIYLNGTILGMTKREIDSKLDQIIDFSGIEEFIDTPVKRYSSGMYARLGFSVAAHVNPDILIVDEVLSVGDYLFQQKCMNRMSQIVSDGASVLFVSHNLKSVVEFCPRALLLERGKMIALGPTPEVIAAYLDSSRSGKQESLELKAVVISKVTIRNEAGESMRFRSGEEAWVEIEVTAIKRCSKFSVSFYITDEQFQDVFATSTERLGYGNCTLEAGEVFSCTFQLRLNMTVGVYYPSVLVYRYDTQTEYDRRAPAATIHISSEEGISGIANCFPRLIRQEIRAAADGGSTAMALEAGASGS
jgi:lipopolysaccharide transport system ATP-binding protein